MSVKAIIISIVFAVAVTVAYMLLSKNSYLKTVERLSDKGEHRKVKYQKVSRMALAYIIFNFAFGIIAIPIIAIPTLSDVQVDYFDIYGNQCTSYATVPMYDEKGNQYVLDTAHNVYVADNGDTFSLNELYLTKSGCVVVVEDIETITDSVELYSTQYEFNVPLSYNNEYYSLAFHPYWDYKGSLVVCESDKDLIVIDYDTQLEYRQENDITFLEN
ncbi:MAG: hypothetical protein K2H13_01835 [Eubacterium sp.]|nr:hypothetical protein [Eubacterium sp.]MDE6155112.1 hypothetical protein [Eubacterium sp.]